MHESGIDYDSYVMAGYRKKMAAKVRAAQFLAYVWYTILNTEYMRLFHHDQDSSMEHGS